MIVDRDRWRRLRGPLFAVFAGGGALPLFWLQPAGGPAGPAGVVRRGTFVDAVVESGTLAAAEMRVYGSTIPGAAVKLVDIVPEGTEVRRGDVLLQFDPGPFELQAARELAALQQAEAELGRVTEDERLEALMADADGVAGELAVTSAESSLRDAADGRGRVDLAAAEVAAADAARRAEEAQRTRDDIRALLERGFATRAEATRADDALDQARDQARLAAMRLAALSGFERPAALDRGRADLDSARRSLARTREAAAARLAQRRAARDLAGRRVDEARARVAQIRDHLARTVVVADGDGLVVYRDLFFGSERRKPQVGDEVWSNQPVLAVPNASRLQVEARVREIDLPRVQRSTRVVVTVEALPNVVLQGTVALVGALAIRDDESGRRSFPITVRLDAHDPGLRPGMTARVEIIASSRTDALIVPAASVFGPADDRYVIVRDVSGSRRVPVRIEADNAVDMVVAGRLAPGDRVELVNHEADGASR